MIGTSRLETEISDDRGSAPAKRAPSPRILPHESPIENPRAPQAQVPFAPTKPAERSFATFGKL